MNIELSREECTSLLLAIHADIERNTQILNSLLQQTRQADVSEREKHLQRLDRIQARGRVERWRVNP